MLDFLWISNKTAIGQVRQIIALWRTHPASQVRHLITWFAGSLLCWGRAADISEKKIILLWDGSYAAADGDTAVSYWIFRDGNRTGTTTRTAFTDTLLAPNTSYRYAIYAIDDAGNRSADAATAHFTTAGDTIPPAPPTGLQVFILFIY